MKGDAARIAVITIGILALALGMLAVLVYVTNTGDYPSPRLQVTARINIGLSAFSMLVGLGFFIVLVAAGASDSLKRAEMSRLYPPLVFSACCLCLVGVIIGINALDRMVHDLRLEWMLFNEPDFATIQSAIIVGIFLGFGWTSKVILELRGWSKRNTNILSLSIIAVCALITFVAFATVGD